MRNSTLRRFAPALLPLAAVGGWAAAQAQTGTPRTPEGRQYLSQPKWWLFYADTQLSNKNHLRNVKVTELKFNPDGTIPTIDPFRG